MFRGGVGGWGEGLTGSPPNPLILHVRVLCSLAQVRSLSQPLFFVGSSKPPSREKEVPKALRSRAQAKGAKAPLAWPEPAASRKILPPKAGLAWS